MHHNQYKQNNFKNKLRIGTAKVYGLKKNTKGEHSGRTGKVHYVAIITHIILKEDFGEVKEKGASNLSSTENWSVGVWYRGRCVVMGITFAGMVSGAMVCVEVEVVLVAT